MLEAWYAFRPLLPLLTRLSVEINVSYRISALQHFSSRVIL
jgi:hypothetical protein